MTRSIPILLVALTALAAGWPDARTPVRTGARAEADGAVIIGNRQYGLLPDVPYADRDAEAFALWAMNTRGIPITRIHRVTDATTRGMELALQEGFRQVGPEGTLWIYFAGQALMSPHAGTHLLLGLEADTDLNHVERWSIPLEALADRAETDDVGHVVFLGDISFVGAGRDGEPVVPDVGFQGSTPSARPTAAFTSWVAAEAYELAHPLHEVRQGAFTWAMLGALKGWADGVIGERDGVVTLDEAIRYVEATLPAVGVLEQHPVAGVHPSRRSFQVASGRLMTTPPLDQLVAQRQPVLPHQIADALDAETLEARNRREQQAEIRRQFQQMADEQWPAALSAFHTGTPDGVDKLRRYVDRFRARHYRLEWGEVIVTAEQIPEALAMLRGRRSPWRDSLRFVRFEPATTPPVPSGVTEPWPPLTDGVAVERPFELSDTEVTQRLWVDLMGFNAGFDRDRSKPVTGVSFYDAVLFCNRLSEADGLLPAYQITGRTVTWDVDADGYRLPTVAEWGIALASDSGWSSFDAPDAACTHANIADTSYAAPLTDVRPSVACDDGHAGLAAVRSYPANPAGLYDLTGNVAEWTWDAAEPDANPLVARRRPPRVAVGGSFRLGPAEARFGRIEALDAGTQRADLGFRVARTVF